MTPKQPATAAGQRTVPVSLLREALTEAERLAYIIEGRDPKAKLIPPHGQTSNRPRRVMQLLQAAIEAEAAAPTPAEPLDRGTIERACIAVVGPWFDESHERGSFRPMELAQRILREADRLAAARPEADHD